MITVFLYLIIFWMCLYIFVGMFFTDSYKELTTSICIAILLLFGLQIHNELRNAIIHETPYTYTKLDVAELNGQMVTNSYTLVKLDESIPKDTKNVYRKEKKIGWMFYPPQIKYVLKNGD